MKTCVGDWTPFEVAPLGLYSEVSHVDGTRHKVNMYMCEARDTIFTNFYNRKDINIVIVITTLLHRIQI